MLLVKPWITSPGLEISLRRHVSKLGSIWSLIGIIVLEISRIHRRMYPLLVTKILDRS